MRIIRSNLIFLPLIIVALSVAAFGQSLQEKIAKFEKPKDYKVEYDKFKDTTSFYSPSKRVKAGKWTTSLQSYMFFSFAGTELNDNTPRMYLCFESNTVDWAYGRSHQLILLLDGKRLDMGDGHRESRVNHGTVTEWMLYKLEPEDLAVLTAARSVELQLGNTEGQLNDEMLTVIRNVASLIK